MKNSIIIVVATIVCAGICWANDSLNFQETKMRVLASKNANLQTTAQANLVKGKAYLAENGKKENVITLPSGLQYQVLRAGKGVSPKPNDTVTVHYRGVLINGIEFDSSYKRGKPETFQVSRVIRGWQEGLQLMTPGAEYKLFIPPDLAYGERGAGSKIGPNSTLIFEIRLLSVKGEGRPSPRKEEKKWPNNF